jgi:hypothetical protein
MRRVAVLGAVWLFAGGLTDAVRSDPHCAELQIRLEAVPSGISTVSCARGFAGTESVDARGPRTIFVVAHHAAGGNAYVVRTPVQQIVYRMITFAAITAWGASSEIDDFDVRRFTATRSEVELPMACFGFVRYSGHVAQINGYRHVVAGFHCDLAGSEASDSRIDELIGGIEADFW